MKITAAVVPVRSAPFEIETLDLADCIKKAVGLPTTSSPPRRLAEPGFLFLDAGHTAAGRGGLSTGGGGIGLGGSSMGGRCGS